MRHSIENLFWSLLLDESLELSSVQGPWARLFLRYRRDARVSLDSSGAFDLASLPCSDLDFLLDFSIFDSNCLSGLKNMADR